MTETGNDIVERIDDAIKSYSDTHLFTDVCDILSSSKGEIEKLRRELKEANIIVELGCGIDKELRSELKHRDFCIKKLEDGISRNEKELLNRAESYDKELEQLRAEKSQIVKESIEDLEANLASNDIGLAAIKEVEALQKELAELKAENEWRDQLTELRDSGWAVAVHNDYKLNDIPHTFWLFTKSNTCVKGEGLTDAEAISEAFLQHELLQTLPKGTSDDRA